MRLLLFCFSVFLALCPLQFAQAEDIVLKDGEHERSLRGHIHMLVDPSAQLTIQDVTTGQYADSFSHKKDYLGIGYTNDAHWYHFTISRETTVSPNWVLAFSEIYIDAIDIYLPNQKGYEKKALGDLVAYDKRQLKTRQHSLILDVSEKPETYYFRFKSNSSLLSQASLFTVEHFIAKETSSNLGIGIYIGILISVIMIYCIFSILVRDDQLFAYFSFVLALLIFHLGSKGVAAVFLPGNAQWAVAVVDASTGSGVILSAITMTYTWLKILRMRENFPRIHRAYMISLIPVIGTLMTVGTSYYPIIAPWISVYAVTNGIVFLILLSYWIRKTHFATEFVIYFLALFFPIAGAFLSSLATAGFLDNAQFYTGLFQYSALGHIIILLIGLAIRMRSTELQRLRAVYQKEQQQQFLSFLSHELRGPLATVGKTAQMIEVEENNLSEQSGIRLSRIREIVDYMGQQIKSFLASEVLRRGRLSLAYENVSLSSLVNDLLDILPEDAVRRRLKVEMIDRDVVLSCDRSFMLMALQNPLLNSFKYSFADSDVHLRVDADEGFVSVAISDHGPGMNIDEIEKAGDILFRGEASSQSEGSGIGLLLTRLVVEAHGGDFQLENNSNGGLTVRLVMPAQDTGAVGKA